jgi:glycerophosphoryl diester phosphodiesterase
VLPVASRSLRDLRDGYRRPITKVIGHRGAPRQARENTVDAFVAARAAGADMVELDVRRTADDALVVHHDAVLRDGRVIVETSLGDLPDWLPSLDAALDGCAGMGVNVEIKNSPRDPDFDADDRVAGAVAALVARRAFYDRVIVSCFNARTIAAVKAADGAIPTGWLTLPGIDPAHAIETVVAGAHQAWHPHDASVTADAISAAHAVGVQVNTWTVDDVGRMQELAGWGIDGIVTNVPDHAVAALRGR